MICSTRRLPVMGIQRAGACFRIVYASGSACDDAVIVPHDLVLSQTRFVDTAPYPSDCTYERLYHRSLRERDTDCLTTRDYLWRDTDWFWCLKNLGAQNPRVRRLLGRERLNSVFYTKVMRWNSPWGLTAPLDALLGRPREW